MTVYLIDGFSVEMATAILTAIIGGYTMIGGLGATFYASYFNTAFIFLGMFIFCFCIYTNEGETRPYIGINLIEYCYCWQFHQTDVIIVKIQI